MDGTKLTCRKVGFGIKYFYRKQVDAQYAHGAGYYWHDLAIFLLAVVV